MPAILLESVVVSALKAAGVKASTEESVEWSGDYVILARTGGTNELFGSDLTGWTGREQVELDFSVYSTSQIAALQLAYLVIEVCRNLPRSNSRISNPLLDNPAQLPTFNNQPGYTFGGSFTVNQNTTQGG